MWIGKSRESKEMPFGMSWPSNPIKALRIYFGNDSTICQYLNWEHKIGNIKKLLDIWKRRKITLIGKILILKNLVIAKLVYTASVLSILDDIISKVKSMLYKFVWDNKPDKIKRNTLIGDYNQGGLKMPDIKSLITALLAKYAYRLTNHSLEKWTILPSYFLQSYGGNLEVFKMSLKCVNHLHFYIHQYRHFIKRFLIGGGNVKTPLNFRDVRKQFIWGNNFITLNNKPIFKSNLSNAGLEYVNDLLDHQNILLERFLRSKISRKSDWMSQTYILITALSDPWEKMLRSYSSTDFCKHHLFLIVEAE